jgi:RNA polymerase primary sigma factor
MRQLKIQNRITDRRELTVDKYISELSGERYSPLTPEQEIECAVKIQQGDEKALERLVNANLRFVVSVAKQYDNFPTITLMDLINEGNIGLIKAAKRFDHTRGFKFISYAVWWIRQTILSFLSEHSRLVKLPLNKNQAIRNINKTIRSLEQDLGRTPAQHEIEAAFSKTDYATKHNINDLSEYLTLDNKPLSLDHNMSKDSTDSFTLLDVISADKDDNTEPLKQTSLQIELSRYINTLKYREKQVIELFYGLNGHEPHSLDQIGLLPHIDLTRERVRQIKMSGIRRLKARIRHRGDLLRQFLG